MQQRPPTASPFDVLLRSCPAGVAHGPSSVPRLPPQRDNALGSATGVVPASYSSVLSSSLPRLFPSCSIGTSILSAIESNKFAAGSPLNIR